MKLLNLGCGDKFHKDWINIDFNSNNENVNKYDLLKGIPYNDNTFDFVYHSHLLEHFTKTDAYFFLKECYRVLRKEGIIRVAVPDMEMITRNYLKFLEKALDGDITAEANYDFSIIELLDQCTRKYSGGELGKLYRKGYAINSDFIKERTGIQLKKTSCYEYSDDENETIKNKILKPDLLEFILKNISKKKYNFYKTGKFVCGGEIHQWMYDRFSLGRILKKTGFSDIKKFNADESYFAEWHIYNLDLNSDGTTYKTDSIYLEAKKIK